MATREVYSSEISFNQVEMGVGISEGIKNTRLQP